LGLRIAALGERTQEPRRRLEVAHARRRLDLFERIGGRRATGADYDRQYDREREPARS
jgi:hypothetical protein